VKQCSHCGTNLPENARFCLQCGTEAPATPEPAQPPGQTTAQAPLDFTQPALAGGMVLGLLSSIPFINLGNCFCCMWVLGGGALSAHLLMKQRPTGITYGDGAFGGAMSGLFGAIVATLFQIPMRYILSRTAGAEQAIEEMIQQFPTLDPEMLELLRQVASPDLSLVSLIFTFMANVLVFSLFAMIGGILAVAVLQKQKNKSQWI
jgi:hypothetical protein